MKKSQHSISAAIFSCLFLLASGILAVAQEQPGNPEYNWLNGKWTGRTLSNAPFQIDLRVMNDNEVKGSGVWQDRIQGRLRPQTVPISGIVKDNKVTLDIQFGNGVFKYSFTYVDGTLRLKRKNDEVDFKKVE